MTLIGVTVKGVTGQNEVHSCKKMLKRQLNAATEVPARDKVSQKHLFIHMQCVCVRRGLFLYFWHA